MITYLGTANNTGCAACGSSDCICQSVPRPTPFYDNEGRQIFLRPINVNFLIVVEAVPGSNGSQVGTTLKPNDPAQPPDLQIQVNRSLGNGSAVVDCRGIPTDQWGGVPAVNPPTLDFSQAVIDAMTDFACRFSAQASDEPCTLDASGDGNEYLTPNAPSTIQQFCRGIESADVFPTGDTIVTARVRDKAQNPGPTKQIVIRVATPTP